MTASVQDLAGIRLAWGAAKALGAAALGAVSSGAGTVVGLMAGAVFSGTPEGVLVAGGLAGMATTAKLTSEFLGAARPVSKRMVVYGSLFALSGVTATTGIVQASANDMEARGAFAPCTPSSGVR